MSIMPVFLSHSRSVDILMVSALSTGVLIYRNPLLTDQTVGIPPLALELTLPHTIRFIGDDFPLMVLFWIIQAIRDDFEFLYYLLHISHILIDLFPQVMVKMGATVDGALALHGFMVAMVVHFPLLNTVIILLGRGLLGVS